MSPSRAIRLPLIMLTEAQPNTFPPWEVVSPSTINALISLPDAQTLATVHYLSADNANRRWHISSHEPVTAWIEENSDLNRLRQAKTRFDTIPP